MKNNKPIFISPKGGSIACFRGDSGAVFLSYFSGRCIYSDDFASAKAYLNSIEKTNILHYSPTSHDLTQTQTTLKWNPDGEISSVDMARIVNRLGARDLTSCELTCQRVISYVPSAEID